MKRALIVVVGATVAMIMVFLGLWQMSTFRTQGAEANRQRAEQPAVTLPAQASGEEVMALYGRQVTVTGEYLPDHQVYVGEAPPMRVLTAFRTTDGRVIAIVRGQVARGQKPPPPPPGRVTQTGLLMPSEKKRDELPAQDLPQPRIPAVKLEALAQSWPGPMVNGFLTLGASDSKSQTMTPVQVELPEGEGRARNAGYALQWWVFAAFALVMTVVWARQVSGAPRRPGRSHYSGQGEREHGPTPGRPG